MWVWRTECECDGDECECELEEQVIYCAWCECESVSVSVSVRRWNESDSVVLGDSSLFVELSVSAGLFVGMSRVHLGMTPTSSAILNRLGFRGHVSSKRRRWPWTSEKIADGDGKRKKKKKTMGSNVVMTPFLSTSLPIKTKLVGTAGQVFPYKETLIQ